MRKSRLLRTDDASEATFELDLSPMLSLMVTLIPMLLLSVAFVQITMIETALPQAVQQAIENDRNKKEREIQVKLVMSQEVGFSLSVAEDGRVVNSKTLPRKADGWDLDGLQGALVGIKQKYPKTFRLDLFPEAGVTYDQIVKVIDEARTIKDKNQKVQIQDQATGQMVPTDVMFPDVIFANVVEG